jgi:hypothetical protein
MIYATPLARWPSRFEIVELLEPIDGARAGARGGVLEFLGPDSEIAEIEIMEPPSDEILDRIVYAPLSKLRVVTRASEHS